jgi:uracil-DNA glycosylase family 4
MAIGEASGIAEDQAGKPFIGKSGRELTRYLARSSKLNRDEIYVTNLVKERPQTKRMTGNNPPTAADIHRDEPELVQEILSIAPMWIVAIGRYSLQWLLGRKATVTDCHGFAYPLPNATIEKIARLTGAPMSRVQNRLGECKVISVTHPAAGLHDTDTQSEIHFDFVRLGQFVRGELDPTPPVDQYPNPDYREVEVLPSLTPRNVALDTEGLIPDIWCSTLTWKPGMSRLVLVDKPRALESFRRFVLYSGHTFELHNGPHDIAIICYVLGIDIYQFSELVDFEDTMQMAFTQRLVPKALKQLGSRFEGVKDIRKYMEVVGPYDQAKAEKYLMRIVTEFACPVCEGSGRTLNTTRRHKTSGKLLEPRLEKCVTCEGDGTTWEPPQEKFVWDPGKQRVRISRGWRMGRRVRAMLNKAAEREEEMIEESSDGEVVNDFDESLSETAGDDREIAGLRRKFLNIDYEFRVQVEDTLGPMPEATLRDVPFEDAKRYACLDSDLTHRVRPKLEQMLRADNLWEVYAADRDVIPMVTQMMHVGWKIDVPFLDELSNYLQVEMDNRVYKLERLAGHYVNPNSMNQVGDLLFGQLGLQPVKMTATGVESTDNKVLKDLQIQAAATMDRDPRAKKAFDGLTYILDYRERSKMKSTYTVALPRKVDLNSRLHTQFKLASVATRRLASASPNLMNIPSRSELGRKVKYAFTCDEANVLVDADYEQLEFRILAHVSGETSLINAIRNGLDPHALTTSKIFGIPLEQVTKKMWQRTAAKTVSFAILYGASAPTIKAQLKLLANVDVPESECQRWIDDYTSKGFPAIGEYIADCIAHARRYGYAVDMWGHRRYLPGVHSAVNSIRAEAERVSVNHTIQSAASGIVKFAMAEDWNNVLPKFRQRGYCEPLLQLHDALTHEVQRSLAEEFKLAITKAMASVVDWKVPIVADAKIGTRWGAMEAA